MNILITGASGLLGTHLTKMLLAQRHAVAHLGRKKVSIENVQSFTWDIENGKMEAEGIRWAEAIIHLAGANVSDKRWTASRKREIIDSRVKSSELLAKTLKVENEKLKVFVSASAVGIYGMTTEEKIFTEKDKPASDFFGDCCRKWETAVDLVEEIGIRRVKLRIGIVLAKDGGALPKLSAPVKYFIGSPLGSGKQWMPWIHIDDLCALFLKAVEDKNMNGAYNAIAEQHVTNKEFVKTIGKILHRTVFMPAVPKLILKIMLGEMSGIVTEGSRVSNEKILKAGFVFQHNQLENALKNLLTNQVHMPDHTLR